MPVIYLCSELSHIAPRSRSIHTACPTSPYHIALHNFYLFTQKNYRLCFPETLLSAHCVILCRSLSPRSSLLRSLSLPHDTWLSRGIQPGFSFALASLCLLTFSLLHFQHRKQWRQALLILGVAVEVWPIPAHGSTSNSNPSQKKCEQIAVLGSSTWH